MSREGAQTRLEIEKEFFRLARSMYFTKSVLEQFMKEATRGQLIAICKLIESEQITREETKKKKYLRMAKFPTIKSVDGYDFAHIGFPDGYTKDDLLSLDFVSQAQDFVFYGGCGRGKTHLSIALGILAIQKGYRVSYFETATLILLLKTAVKTGKLEKTLKDIAKSDLLILDEFGYLPIDIEGARLLYQVMSQTYENKSMIITTNIEFSKWGTVLADDKLASSTIDRIIHHGRLLEFGGESRRFSESLMMGNVEK